MFNTTVITQLSQQWAGFLGKSLNLRFNILQYFAFHDIIII